MATPAEAEDMRARAALLRSLREHMVTERWPAATAAAQLGITREYVDDLMSGRISQFSLITLIVLVHRGSVEVPHVV